MSTSELDQRPTEEYLPSPWVAEQRTYGYPDYDGGPEVRLWDVKAANGAAVAFGTIYGDSRKQAHLIAAAPEMLWKLRELASECSECAGTGRATRYRNRVAERIPCRECDDILKVIAKAEGRS
jgi:hypothetical protein